MPAEVRITDPDTVRIVEAERLRRGDATATKTAGNMIRERATFLEHARLRELDVVAEFEAEPERLRPAAA